MSLLSGTRFGPYEIQSPLGAGGMGEVYRAHDTRLGRDVAFKILPESFARDSERMRRFEQEARAVAALNHPNVLAIFDTGFCDGIPYLVSELLEGESLRELLKEGPLPARKTVDYAQQVAEALAAAHDKNIIHRDLKPENIFVTNGGRVKLLDFGLAKLQAGAAAAGVQDAVTKTMVSGTNPGVVMGTAGYMSPEQVRGEAVDHRTDIFSFGATLYEMLSGERAFKGESSIETMNAILKEEPPELDVDKLRVSPGLERIVRHCLEKKPADRFQSARDLGFALQTLSGTTTTTAPLKRVATKKSWNVWKWAAGGLAVAIAIVAAGYMGRGAGVTGPEIKGILPVSSGISVRTLGDEGGAAAISPDASNLVFVGSAEGKKMLFLMALNGTTARALPGTDGGKFPFWSPDGRSIGFFADKQLKRVDIAGGPPLGLAPAEDARGGTWAGDTILYAPYIYDPIWRVPAGGGKAERVTELNRALHTTHRWPRFLPDGKHFLYLAQDHSGRNQETAGVYVASLDGGAPRLIVRSKGMAFYSSDYLLYYRDGALIAQRFDAGKLELTGEATALGQVLWDTGNWNVLASASDNGVLVYQSPGEVKYPIRWFDRNGQSPGTSLFAGQLYDLRLSPDGRRAAVEAFLAAATASTLVIDLATGANTKLSFGENTWLVVWSPDGKLVAYSAEKTPSENTEILVRPADGSREPKVLLSTQTIDHPTDWTRDGKYLVVNHGRIGAQQILLLPMTGDRKPKPLFPDAKYDHFDARVSPDGRWIAYVSTEFGTNEIFVTSFPSGQGKWQISSAGVQPRPLWGADSKTLYFVSAVGDVVEARLQTSASSITVEALRPLFRSPFLTTTVGVIFDVDPKGGNRFIGSVAPDASALPLNVITNWTAELKKK